ncbi:MAG TPA: APC family permease [Gammaproteobacteria bacterium]|nr:APC family permease [Gammaproteobacteria bacterium]
MKKITILSLTLLITGSIDSIRNLPATALFGSNLIFFFIFGALFFLLPTAMVSAELTSNIGEGGIYQWTRRAFGEKAGFLAIWLQWINVVVWLPTMLSFIAGTAAYLIDPTLAQNKFYVIIMILAIFWAITLINLRSIHVSSRFASLCTFAGLILPMTLIIALLGFWVFHGYPVQIHFTTQNFLPDISHMDNWIALTAIMLGFAGMELATVHIKDVDNPTRSFPRALAYSTVIILLTMILGSLAIALVLPANQINLINGTIQTFTYFLSAYHMSALVPVLTLLLVIGSLGGIINWVISPVRGLAQAAQLGYLPACFAAENKHGIPQNLLITQAVLVSIASCLFLCLPSVNGSYWLLTALSTQVYMFMYVCIFIDALRLRFTMNYDSSVYKIPGGKIGTVITCILGLIGCIITIAVGFIPPDNINIGSKFNYELIFCGGMIAMILPVFFCYWYKASRKAVPEIQSDDELAPAVE